VEANRMTRIRKHGTELTIGLEMCLTLGPSFLWVDDLSEADLEFGWREHGEAIVGTWERRHGSRPYGWWRFTIGEEPPPMEPGADVIRLAQLGELTEGELGDLRKKAVEATDMLEGRKPICFVSTGDDKHTKDFIREDIEIYERVIATLQERG
jgi:hypothetical protein